MTLSLAAAGCQQPMGQPAPRTDTGPVARAPDPEIGAVRPAARNPEEARRLLQQGNGRFVAGEGRSMQVEARQRQAQAESQAPFAVVLSCADSRVPVSTVFDQSPGNLFVVRVAGNISEPAALGSIEYAVRHLQPSVVVVMGHEACGAVHAARLPEEQTQDEPEHVQYILEQLRPVVRDVRGGDDDRGQLREAVIANVREQKRRLEQNPVVAEAVRDGRIQVIGAYYNIGSGRVQFLDDPATGRAGGTR